MIRLLTISALFSVSFAVTGIARAAETDRTGPEIAFRGYADADVYSDFGTLNRFRHTPGLEIDLRTILTFNPRLRGVVHTTMTDGAVPAQGSGAAVPRLRYDGAEVHWLPGESMILLAGDLRAGTGYFHYYRNKRTAAVVGEHSVRGVGVRNGGMLVHAGLAADTSGTPGAWSVFGRWNFPIHADMTWTPSARYTGGIPGATPFELGLSFEGLLKGYSDAFRISGHAGIHYWNPDVDPGMTLLIEPRYTIDAYFLSLMFFYHEKGEVPAPNSTRQTLTREPLDDLILYAEPGMSLNETFAVGLPLEFHNESLTSGGNESFWMVPTLYIYPGPGPEWWVWGRVEKPLRSGSTGHPRFALGSEFFFNF